MERATRRIVAYEVLTERTQEALQEMVLRAPFAKNYYSDGFEVYPTLWYPGTFTALNNKSQTYNVEGDNAELRHYLARLARRSRCFTRSLEALRRALDLFVHCWNRRQTFKRENPKLPAHLINFLAVP